MKLKEIHRTSTFAWSPTASSPLLATGTVAGALDESFSNESQLEIWTPDFGDEVEFELGTEGGVKPTGTVTDTARFNRVAWGYVNSARPQGLIAAGMENGQLALWDPSKIIGGDSSADSLVYRNSTHTGPVRGLDFNPLQNNLLSSGAVGGEVYVWDMTDPSKPYTPTSGGRSNKLDEIASVAWNQQVAYILAGASNTGYTVVWDLRGKREVVALSHGGNNSLGGPAGMGGRRGMSDIAWHPNSATRLVTASDDDSSPVILVWDLRNANAPEKILTGHERGVLSLSWCSQDADLLLSSGKDNRALCWNPQTYDIIGELPSAGNWAFQVDWCPRNPNLLATAFFDGKIDIHSVQSTNVEAAATASASRSAVSAPNGADLFDLPHSSSLQGTGSLTLSQPPKWLKPQSSASFGFGGQLVSVSNLPSAQGKNQSSVVHLRNVVTEEQFVSRATQLHGALSHGPEAVKTLAQQKDSEGGDTWRALLSLFQADSRDELVTLLGFDKSEIKKKVQDAVERLRLKSVTPSGLVSPAIEADIVDEAIETRPPVVSFAEPPESHRDASPPQDGEGVTPSEKTPSEFSATSDLTSGTHLADGESTTTVPSLFGDDNDAPGTPQHDFFSSLTAPGGTAGTGESPTPLVPHTNYALASSVAATIGSRPSSIASEAITKNNTFRIYPVGSSDEAETEKLVTRALVLGDFESAVELCLSAGRYADAIIFAARGGPELFAKTQKAYFEAHTSSDGSSLRLFQSIVQNDLQDIVQNAELSEWKEIFVVLCTFVPGGDAGQEEFAGLVEELGRRLEFQFALDKDSDEHADLRKQATLTYLAAGRLERLVGIWVDEMVDEEKHLAATETQHSAHANALQSFVEKIAVFQAATKYVDTDLSSAKSGAVYKLASLYDRYFDYAELLASQGLVKEAAAVVSRIPTGYQTADSEVKKQRLFGSSGPVPAAAASAPVAPRGAPASKGIPVAPSFSGYPTPVAPSQVPGPYSYAPPPLPQAPVAPVSTAYAPPPVPLSNQGYGNAPTQYNPYGNSAPLQTQLPPTNTIPPPPPRIGSSISGIPVAPPPKAKAGDNGGWNDAPAVTSSTRTTAHPGVKAHAITSPFPNSPSPSFGSPGGPGAPPRPGSRAGSVLPPPPPRSSSGMGMAPPPPPPARMMSPGSQHQQAQASNGSWGPPPRSGLGQTPPPIARPPLNAPPARATPPLGPPSSAYAPPPQGAQQNSGPYGPPHGSQLPGPPSSVSQTLPPPPSAPGPYGPPPGQRAPVGQVPPVAAPPPATPKSPPAPRGPPPPKYPAGDRSHIPEEAKPAFEVLAAQLDHFKRSSPPQQKRLVEDLDRRLNSLFDALNCETLSKPVVEQLTVLTRAMAAHDRPAALAIHVDLLTRGSQTDDIGIWMSGIKQMIMRL